MVTYQPTMCIVARREVIGLHAVVRGRAQQPPLRIERADSDKNRAVAELARNVPRNGEIRKADGRGGAQRPPTAVHGVRGLGAATFRQANRDSDATSVMRELMAPLKYGSRPIGSG